MSARHQYALLTLAASLISVALMFLSSDASRAQGAASPTPDGGGTGLIAFASDRDGNFEIYVMNTDGSDPRNLTQNSAYDLRPAWSPDGSQIAFMSDRDGNFEIYVMNTDGSSLRNLTQNSAEDRWSSYRTGEIIQNEAPSLIFVGGI